MSIDSVQHRLLSTKVPQRAIDIVRVVIGYTLLIRGFWSWNLLNRVYGQGLCTLPIFDWLPVLPKPLIPLFGIVWCVSASLFLLGIRSALTGTILVTQVAYLLALDQQLYANHLYLMGLICGVVTLACFFEISPAEQDRIPERHREISYWPIFLLKFQLSVVYFFAAITKFTPSFMSGQTIAGVLRKSGPFAFPESMLVPPIVAAMVWGTIVTELFLCVAFWWDSTRRIACVIGVCFHLCILAWISPANFWELFVFALEMFALYSVFFWKPQDPSVSL